MKAVIFDLYETLITEYQPECKDPRTWSRLGLQEEDGQREWRLRHDARMKGEISDFPSVLREICRALGVKANEMIIDELYQERLKMMERPFLNIEPSVLNMIRSLRAAGMRVTVLSNAAVEEVAAWENSILADVIDHPVFSFQVGCMKPDPKIYKLACERIGSAPEETMFVGDGGSHELSGARMAGLIPVWATWFLDRWPSWRMQHVDPAASECHRCRRPEDVLKLVCELRSNA